MRQSLLGLAPGNGQVMPLQFKLLRHELRPEVNSFLDNDLNGVRPPPKTHSQTRSETPVGGGLDSCGGRSHTPESLQLGGGNAHTLMSPSSLRQRSTGKQSSGRPGDPANIDNAIVAQPGLG